MKRQRIRSAKPLRSAGSMGTWVKNCNGREVKWKRAVARYCASHLIDYGTRVQMGSGTTFTYFMDEILESQKRTKKALDLVLLTTNLTVLQKGRDAQLEHGGLFGSMQIILTGGSLEPSLHSLVGEYAARGVSTELITPDLVCFGTAGLHIDELELQLTYQFEGELSTQVSYATRKTTHRVLICDHTKLGCQCGLKADVSLEAMLKQAEVFSIISSLPPLNDPVRAKVLQQFAAFKELIARKCVQPEFRGKQVGFYLIDEFGNNKMSAEMSRNGTRTPPKGEDVKSSLPGLNGHRKFITSMRKDRSGR